MEHTSYDFIDAAYSLSSSMDDYNEATWNVSDSAYYFSDLNGTLNDASFSLGLMPPSTPPTTDERVFLGWQPWPLWYFWTAEMRFSSGESDTTMPYQGFADGALGALFVGLFVCAPVVAIVAAYCMWAFPAAAATATTGVAAGAVATTLIAPAAACASMACQTS